MNIVIYLSRRETHMHNTWKYMKEKMGYLNKYILLSTWDLLKSFEYFEKNFIKIVSIPPYDRYLVTAIPLLISNKTYSDSKTIFFTSFTFWEKRPIFFRSIWKKLLDSTTLVATTDYAAKSIKDTYGIQAYEVIPHSIDTDEIKPLNQGRCKEKNPTVLFVGRMVYEKGVLDLLRVAKKMQNVNFWFVGKGYLSNFITNISKRMKNVRYYGYVDRKKLVELYSKAWLFVLPSFTKVIKYGDIWSEFFGVSILESLACYTPVIASDTPGPLFIKKYVGKPVEIFKQKNTKKMRNKISTLIEDGPEYLRSLGKKGRKGVNKYFSSRVVSKKWMKVFNSLSLK